MKFKNFVYLDTYATTPCSEENAKYLNKFLSNLNPSATYAKKERAVIDNLKHNLANYFKSNPVNILFNAGGSEGNDTIINSFGIFNNGNIVCSSLDHPCIVNKFNELKAYNVDARIISLKNGKLTAQDVLKNIDNKTNLVVLTHVFSEIGSLNDIQNIAMLIKQRHQNIHIHVDAVQSFLKTKLPISTKNIDSIAISFHKIGALKGCGALWIRHPQKIVPLISGTQNYGLRGGTMPVANLASAYYAIGEINKLNQIQPDWGGLITYLCRNLKQHFGKDLFIFTDLRNALGNCLMFSINNVCGKDLQEALLNTNVIVGRGSACKSKSEIISPSVKSFNLPESWCSPLRVSWNKRSSQKCIDIFLNNLIPIVKTLKVL